MCLCVVTMLRLQRPVGALVMVDDVEKFHYFQDIAKYIRQSITV